MPSPLSKSGKNPASLKCLQQAPHLSQAKTNPCKLVTLSTKSLHNQHTKYNNNTPQNNCKSSITLCQDCIKYVTISWGCVDEQFS